MHYYINLSSPNRQTYRFAGRLFLFLLLIGFGLGLQAQAPSSILPDLSGFKLTFPIDANGNDYEGVSYGNRSNPEIKGYEEDNLVGFTPSGAFAEYFYVSGGEVIFKAHCAGALTSPNSYPRCELRQTPNGSEDLWDFDDEQELNATFRAIHLPDNKKEVCMLQIKGADNIDGDGAEEAFRLEYRASSSQGLHVTVNESNTITDVMDYSLNQTIVARMYVNNRQVTIELDNTNVSGSNGEWDTTFTVDSDFDDYGYFKAGCYTQSSIWSEKSGVADEDPDAYGAVAFSALTLGSSGPPSCTATVPGNRSVGSFTSSTATFSWSAVPNIDHYKLRYRAVGGSWVTSPSIRNTTTYAVSGLSANTTYEWQVRSKCPNNTSSSSYSAGQGSNFTTTGGGGPTPLACSDGSNKADEGSIQSYSAQQSANPATNMIDGNTSNRWSAEGFPQSAVIDLEGVYSIDGIRLYPYQNRAYTFYVEGSATSATSGFSMLTDATNNTSTGSSVGKNFSAANVRYVRLTITGANGYSGNWSSVREFKVYCSGLTSRLRADDLDEAARFSFGPNPIAKSILVNLPTESNDITTIQITNMLGQVLYTRSGLQAGEILKIPADFVPGLYLLQGLNAQKHLVQSEKIIKH